MTDTLTVIDSYLSLDSTQYAQAPIGATRLATKGNGTGVSGTVPAWSATSWEIEFDIVFPTTFYGVSNKIIDGANGTARPYITITTAGKFERDPAVIGGMTIDGATVTFGVTTHPVDGGVHHIKLTAAGPTIFGTVLGRYAALGEIWDYCTASLFNLRLTDLNNSANSRYYPMDEAYPAANPTAGPKSMDAFITDAVPVAVDTSTPFGLGAFVNNGNGSYTATNDDSGANISWSVPDSTAMYRVTVTAVFTQGSRLKMDSTGLYEIEGNGQHILYICPSVVSLTRVQFARQSTAVTVTLSNITIEKMPNAGTWFNRTSGDVVTVYPGAIKPAEGFWIACKFRLPVVEASKYLMSLGNFVSGGSSFILRTDAASKLVATRANNTSAINSATYVALTDNVEYTVVIVVAADGSIAMYVNDIGNTATAAAGTAFITFLNWINLNGAKTTDGASSTRTAIDFFYAFVYTGAPTVGEITDILAGGDPNDVGVFKQVYNLAGDYTEVNGGPDLTPYGSPTFGP